MRILVFGAGAIGSVVGGFLAKAGHEVTFLGRAWYLDVVKRQGYLTMTGLWGEHRVPVSPESSVVTEAAHPLTLTTTPEEAASHGPFDWVLLCVKSHQTAEAAEQLPGVLGPQTLVCALQNGLGNYETLIQRVAPERVALSRVIFGVEITPGMVRVTVCADDVLIGAPDPGFPRKQAVELAAALQASGIPSRATTDILAELWAKVLYNCALNGLSAVLEVPYGKLADHPVVVRVMDAVIEEAYHVGAARQVELRPSTAQTYRELLFTRLIPDTAAHQSSMLQDLRRGKPTEIEALNGAIVRLADAAGIPAPMNAMVTRLVHAKEQFAGAVTPTA